VVRILFNPAFIRAAFVLFCATTAFLLGIIFIRRLRKNIAEEADLTSSPVSLDTLPVHLYNTAIQQLKQQNHALEVQSQAELNRARVSETFGQAILSSLSSGVLVFGDNGLIRTANPAAKKILGFFSATGMGAKDIFRGAVVSRGVKANAGSIQETGLEDHAVRVADEVDVVLHEGSKRRDIEAEYETPAGEKRFLAIAISPILAADESLLGATCLINDLSELEQIRRQQELHGEISAEMALALRSSLTMISGYAQQLADSHDADLAKQLAADISEEAMRLDRSIGGFLTSNRAARSLAVPGSGN
jgi:nitrogen fixation/metabolism regulation signal transduction histidine kinase